MKLEDLERELKKLRKGVPKLINLLESTVEPIAIELRERYRNNIKDFFIDFWDHATTGNALQPGIVVDCISEHLKYLITGDIKTLMIAVPPREGKSTLISVMLPAYLWTINPRLRFLTSSYSEHLAHRDNLYMQYLIQSEMYQYLWGKDFHLLQQSAQTTLNNLNGTRQAINLTGQVLGSGASWSILDDPNNFVRIEYPNERHKVINAYERIFSSRKDNPLEARNLIVQQRCHVEDLIGHELSKEHPDCVYVQVPMEYVGKRKQVTVLPFTNKVVWQDPRTEEGQILSPERYTKAYLDKLKRDMGAMAYNSNYQCVPAPDEGTIFKKEWFKPYKSEVLPFFNKIISSWDTSLSTGAHSSYSAVTVWGMFEDEFSNMNLMLLNTWYGKLEFPELIDQIQRMTHNYLNVSSKHKLPNAQKSDIVLIEAQANGLSIMQTLKRYGIHTTGYTPPKTKSIFRKGEEGKIVRARMISPIVESGRIYLPCNAKNKHFKPYADNFLDICSNYPNNAEGSQDLVDTFTMVCDFLNRKNLLLSDMELDMREDSVFEDRLQYIDNIPSKKNVYKDMFDHDSGA